MSEENNGFSLIELIVAVAISAIILGALSRLFMSTNELHISQEQVVEVRQNIRSVLFKMTKEIRMAGFNPARNATCSGIISANSTSLHISYDFDGSGSCTDEDRDVDHDYNFVSSENSVKMQSKGGGGYHVMADNISSLNFTYTLADGSTTSTPAHPDHIRMVSVQMCGQISGPYSEKYGTLHCYNSTVRCRNMGL